MQLDTLCVGDKLTLELEDWEGLSVPHVVGDVLIVGDVELVPQSVPLALPE